MSLDPRLKLVMNLGLATAKATRNDADWLDDVQEHLSLALIEVQKLRNPNHDPIAGAIQRLATRRAAGRG